MRTAIIGALLIAAVSTLGDFVWAGLHLRFVYGLAHGTILFFCLGAYFGSLQRNTAKGVFYGAAIGLAAAGSFYMLEPVAGYSVMFFVWAFVWIALAFVAGGPLRRGVLAIVGSGAGFYLSDIWRPLNPEGWDYALQFLSWTIAYLPGFLALSYRPSRR
ncbi:MAG TPA: hypothetical protein VM115_13840 [Vicinamibacterales bacterium]|nr:hypothetical protein [Vicinamibacterales bacterium]